MPSLPAEAVVFMGIIFILLFILVILFLYLNKSLCFANCDGLPFIETGKKAPKPPKGANRLVESYGPDDEESSSDSEDEMVLRYQQSLQTDPLPRQPSIRRSQPKPGFLSGGKDDGSAAEGGDERTLERGIRGELVDDSQLPSEEAHELANDAGLDAVLDEDENRLGVAELVFQYSGENRRMNITIIQCHDLPAKDKGGASSYRLRLVIYPSKRQRAKTRIREGNNPVFKELFRFSRIMPHEIVSTSVRIRLYGAERMRKERLIAEGIVKFSALNVSKKQVVRMNLHAKSDTGDDSTLYSSTSDLSDSGSSIASLTHGGLPELLTGLAYNSTTGRLSVEVIKGSHFKQLAAGRAPDSYVKVALMSSSGFEMTRSKSSVRRGQPNPTFKETFIFQIAQFQLSDVTLMFTVYNKKGMKRKDALGWFSMGLSNTSEEELAHWNEMLSSQGQQVCRWHALLESKS